MVSVIQRSDMPCERIARYRFGKFSILWGCACKFRNFTDITSGGPVEIPIEHLPSEFLELHSTLIYSLPT